MSKKCSEPLDGYTDYNNFRQPGIAKQSLSVEPTESWKYKFHVPLIATNIKWDGGENAPQGIVKVNLNND